MECIFCVHIYIFLKFFICHPDDCSVVDRNMQLCCNTGNCCVGQDVCLLMDTEELLACHEGLCCWSRLMVGWVQVAEAEGRQKAYNCQLYSPGID